MFFVNNGINNFPLKGYLPLRRFITHIYPVPPVPLTISAKDYYIAMYMCMSTHGPRLQSPIRSIASQINPLMFITLPLAATSIITRTFLLASRVLPQLKGSRLYPFMDRRDIIERAWTSCYFSKANQILCVDVFHFKLIHKLYVDKRRAGIKYCVITKRVSSLIIKDAGVFEIGIT